MSNLIKHIPCLKCGSSDGNAIYDDNHEYCHVCGNYIKGDGEEVNTEPTRKKIMLDIKGQIMSISDRGITRDTCQYYGVTQDNTTMYNQITLHKSNLDNDGSLSGTVSIGTN